MIGRHKVDFKSMQWEIPAEGARFKAFEQNGKKLRLVEFRKEFVEPGWCIKGHIGYVLYGQIEIDFNGEKEVFNSGDGIFILAGEKHKGRAITDKVKMILVKD